MKKVKSQCCNKLTFLSSLQTEMLKKSGFYQAGVIAVLEKLTMGAAGNLTNELEMPKFH
jgi:hypothetical protein